MHFLREGTYLYGNESMTRIVSWNRRTGGRFALANRLHWHFTRTHVELSYILKSYPSSLNCFYPLTL